jgi:hypothetical protein
MAPSSPPIFIDFILVIVPLAICAYFALKGIVPVFKGKFFLVTIAMFAASVGISLVLSFLSFATLSVMDDAVNGMNVFTGGIKDSTSSSSSSTSLSEIANSIVVPACKIIAQSRFVRSVLVTFAQPTFLSVSGIACCLMLVYVRESIIRVGGDVTVLLEHFAIFSQATSSATVNTK